MKVVFLEEVEGTARTGDVKNVADGFARNFLLPRKLAAPATDHYITIAQARANKEAKRQERLDDEARDRLLPQVDGKSLTMEVRVGEQGKLFGSVTARDIAEALQESTRIELEHRQVDLREPIREIGVHEVPVKLTRNVIATVTVSVEPIGGLPAPEAVGEADEAAEPEENVGATFGAGGEEPGKSPEEGEQAADEAPAEEEITEEEPEGDTEQS